MNFTRKTLRRPRGTRASLSAVSRRRSTRAEEVPRRGRSGQSDVSGEVLTKRVRPCRQRHCNGQGKRRKHDGEIRTDRHYGQAAPEGVELSAPRAAQCWRGNRGRKKRLCASCGVPRDTLFARIVILQDEAGLCFARTILRPPTHSEIRGNLYRGVIGGRCSPVADRHCHGDESPNYRGGSPRPCSFRQMI